MVIIVMAFDRRRRNRLRAWLCSSQRLADNKVGMFIQALYDEAKKNGWNVISMKNGLESNLSF